jgi:hypothetical protein
MSSATAPSPCSRSQEISSSSIRAQKPHAGFQNNSTIRFPLNSDIFRMSPERPLKARSGGEEPISNGPRKATTVFTYVFLVNDSICSDPCATGGKNQFGYRHCRDEVYESWSVCVLTAPYKKECGAQQERIQAQSALSYRSRMQLPEAIAIGLPAK